MYTSELTRLNAWHQERVALAVEARRYVINESDDMIRRIDQCWGPTKGGPLPIRGRDDEIDRWIEDEYADQADGWCPERFDPELLLAFI